MITMLGIQPDAHHRFETTKRLTDLVIGIKGAGEMASGIACSLYKANISKIFMMEIEYPLAVRRMVSFCASIYAGTCQIEGVGAVLTHDKAEIYAAWEKSAIAVIQDPEWKSIAQVRPDVVIDATIAKTNLGTKKDEAPLVIGLGPGFEAGEDVHLVIETNRGHDLGRIIERGCAHPNTGVPGNIGGYTGQRVLRAPCDGLFETQLEIGVPVKKNQPIGRVGDQEVIATISGVLRGLILPDSKVIKGLKIGDIDPRGKVEYCTTISEKARALGGSVLEGILSKLNTMDLTASTLASAIGLSARGVASVIGAGGKTSLMFRLANELTRSGKTVLTTSTTKIFFPHKDQSPHTIVEASIDKLIAKMTATIESEPHCSAGTKYDEVSGKLLGIPPEAIDRIWQAGLFDVIIVEADGSKQLPLKASAGHEPVMPWSTSHLVHVTGLDAIGQSIESVVHRPNIFMENIALESGTLLTESHLIDCILLELQKADTRCRSLVNTVVLNKADTVQIENQGKAIANQLKGHRCVHRLAVLALNQADPVKYYYQIN